MFRFTQEPSSRSQSQCLAKITGMVPLCLLICALPVMAVCAAITLANVEKGEKDNRQGHLASQSEQNPRPFIYEVRGEPRNRSWWSGARCTSRADI